MLHRLKSKKVICAMSGGVDSSVATALLKEEGFEVSGVFMKLYDSTSFEKAEARAKRIAKILEIPLLSLDLRKEFKKRIIDYFLEEYKKGRTPNPCVVCNKEIKFGLLLEKALALDADFVATGHYARLRREFSIFQPSADHPQGGNFQFSKFKLFRAKDKNKDQSYFLWQLSQEQLKHILFPVGNYTKTQVRNLAKKFNLPVLDIPESMEICFIQTTINDFLKRHLNLKPGKIIYPTPGVGKEVVGEHQGLWFYTIGQRKGLGLAGGPASAKASAFGSTKSAYGQTKSAGKPFYVLDKDFKKNLLIVTKDEKDLYKKELVAKNVNWISGKVPKLPLKVKAKIRYRHEPALATIKELRNKKLGTVFDKPQRAITPGQSVVFYRNKELLGGGIIC